MVQRKRNPRAVRLESLEARLALTGFTAYNAFFSGPNANPATTNYADAPGKTAAGPLRNVETGELTEVLIGVSSVGVNIGGNGTAPAGGTDADKVFGDFVDFTSAERRTIELPPGTAYQYTFENLDVGGTYAFAGTAIRGNALYTNRWTLVELIGADAFTPSHSDHAGVYQTGLDANQIAFWSGDNSMTAQGSVVGWTDIDPGADGIFHVVSSQYTGQVPTSIDGDGVADGSKGYALSAIRFIEQAPQGPPSLLNSSAEVMAFSAELRGEVVATGGRLPAITIYYGTVDGGTDAASWANAIEVQQPSVSFSQFVDNLEQNTTYFFRSFGAHSFGTAWAPETTSFKTLEANPPAVSSLPPLEVGALSASLAGRVGDTGNDAPHVSLFYGEHDGGTNPESWEETVELGVQVSDFSWNIGDLKKETTYHYTVRAQNNYGAAWGDSISFTTLDIPPLLINEFVANNASTLATRVRTDATQPFVGDEMTPDWIELTTANATAFALSGYYLTDDLGSPRKWQFPAGATIPANGQLVVFASGFNILDPQLDEHGNLHTSFKLDSIAGTELAIVNPDGLVVFAFEQLPTQIEDVSYGVGSVGEFRYFSTPTPGENNAFAVPQAPTINLPSQTFIDSITVGLTAASDAHTIHYTTNEQLPAASSPVYTEPLVLTKSTMVRAMSVGPGGDQSIVVSESYIEFRASVVDDQSQLPLLIVDTFGDGIRSTFEDSFVAIIEPGEDGVSRLTDSFDLATRAGIHIRGSSSSGFSKKQYRVEFRDEQDEDRKLEVLGMPKEADWIFYGPSQYDRVLISNPLMFDLSNQIGRYATRTRWVEAYFNGSYHGVYAITEVIERDDDRVDVEPLSTGAGGQPVEGGFIWKNDRGSAYVDPERLTTAQRRFIDGEINRLVSAAGSTNFKDPEVGYAKYADVDSFVDHNILNLLAMNVDAMRLSSFYYKTADSKLQAGPIWDFDRSLDSTDSRDDNARSWFGTGDSTRYFNDGSRVMSWWSDMFQDPDFVQQYIDRWFELRKNEFSLDNIFGTIDRHAAELGDAADRDYARWARSRYRDFAGEIRHLKDWLEARILWIDSRWMTAPTADVEGDRVAAGTPITLSAAGGDIYYTLDGTDPRGDDGVIRDAAQLAAGAIVVHQSDQLFARIYNSRHGASNGYVRSGDDWSAPLQITSIRTPASAENLTISEIHYNPAAADVLAGEHNEDNDEFEFLEIMNVGEQPIELKGVRLIETDVDGETQGVRFVFDAQILQPGEAIVVVENVDAFRSRYGNDVRIAEGRDQPSGDPGQFAGKLSNGGERLTLIDENGALIRQVDYADNWYRSTDGGGFSLENQRLRETAPDRLNSPAAWRSSATIGGTPGEASQPRLEGDFNADQIVDAADLDLLYAAMGQNDPPHDFDLTGDQQVNAEDVQYLIRNVMRTRAGDTNLDGEVNFQDFLTLAENFGKRETGWSGGDFDGSGSVEFADFLTLAENFGFDAEPALASLDMED